MDVSLYIHVPFCSKKCHYCHFYVIPQNSSHHDLYFHSLKLEWERIEERLNGHKISSIYFGGGTPSLLPLNQLEQILSWCKASTAWPEKTFEITLEANPEDLTKEKLEAYQNLGINRLSMGVQCLDDALLETLGRQHDSKKAIDAVYLAREEGFENISIDLMYDLPGQSLQSWKHSIDQACLLPIKHLSLYNLTIEPHTAFYKKRVELQAKRPSDQDSLQMLEYAVEKLGEAELHRYEISAFAREGYISQHNSGYWTGRPFLGLGPSAFSYWEKKRYRNVAKLHAYARHLENEESPIDFSEELEEEASLRELLAIHLRLLEGVDLPAFEKRWGNLPLTIKQDIERLLKEAYMKQSEEKLQLSEQGLLYYDHVASELI